MDEYTIYFYIVAGGYLYALLLFRLIKILKKLWVNASRTEMVFWRIAFFCAIIGTIALYPVAIIILLPMYIGIAYLLLMQYLNPTGDSPEERLRKLDERLYKLKGYSAQEDADTSGSDDFYTSQTDWSSSNSHSSSSFGMSASDIDIGNPYRHH